MKKIISLSLLLASIGFTSVFASAQTYYPSDNGPQDRYNQRDRNDRNRRNRVWVETKIRIVRKGRTTYRETIQIKHFSNGRTETKVISRVRVR